MIRHAVLEIEIRGTTRSSVPLVDIACIVKFQCKFIPLLSVAIEVLYAGPLLIYSDYEQLHQGASGVRVSSRKVHHPMITGEKSLVVQVKKHFGKIK